MDMAAGSIPKAADPRIGFFDRLAERWDDCGQDAEITLRRLRELTTAIHLRAGQDVLEVGCGTGQITGWLADQVAPGRVLAVDFSRSMLAAAKQKRIAAEFRLADVCCDDLGCGEYDVVLCFHSFPHFRDCAAALANLARALKNDGRLVILHLASSAHVNAFHAGLGGEVRHDYLPEPSAWPRLLAPCGFELSALLDRDDLFLLDARRTGKG